MLAHSRMLANVCSCGGWLPETTSPEADELGYEIDPPTRCAKCTALAIRQEQHSKDHSHLHALRWGAHLKKRVEPD